MMDVWIVTLLSVLFFVADMKAQVSFFFPNLPADVVIPEDRTHAEPVYWVRVNAGFISNFAVEYSFDSSNTADKFQVTNIDGGYTVSVKCGVKLNFEDPVKEYNITFTASGEPVDNPRNLRAARQAIERLTQTVNLSITLSDVNEPPSFGKDIYFLRVTEGSGEHLSSLNMSDDVTDEDTDDDHFTFEITKIYSDMKNLFEIDNSTGDIRLLSGYDIDNNNQSDAVLLVIAAKDKKHLSGTTLVLVNIIDINDNAPDFGQENQIVTVPHTLAVNSTIAYVRACDKDSGNNSKIQYRIQKSTFGNSFEIDETNGVVKYVQALPVMETIVIDLTVLAVDQGHPVALTSTATISIHIEGHENIIPTERVITSGSNGSSDSLQGVNTTTASSVVEHSSCDHCNTSYENGNCERTHAQSHNIFTFFYWLIPSLFIICTSLVICLIILFCVTKSKDKKNKVKPKKKFPDAENEMNIRTYPGQPPVTGGNLAIENIT